MKKFIIIISILILSTGNIASAAITTNNGASLFMRALQTVEKYKTFNLDVLVNTGGESINSIDIGITYPKDLIKFKGYKQESGIVKIWLKQPRDNSAGVIQFSGIIPGGVDGVYDPNLSGLGSLTIVRLLFEGNKEGSGEFKINNSSILINDGHGSPLIYSTGNSTITITNNQNNQKVASNVDSSSTSNDNTSQLPAPFTILFVNSGYFSKTPPLLIFNTTDSQSGIEKYELKKDGGWETALSPLPIHKGILARAETIRAVDFDGNTMESTVTIPGIFSIWTLIFIIILIVIFAYSRFLWYKKRR